MKKLVWWRTQNELMKQIQEMGLTRDQIAAFKKMDRDSVVDEIARIQDERRLELLASGIDIDSFVPAIGREIQWSDVVEMVFRVLEFDRNDTFVDLNRGAESVRAKSEIEPYGYLLVESPTLNQPVRLPIIHNNDYWLASSVFDDPDVVHWINNPETELLVTYAPKRINKNGFSISPHHVLHYVITPRGTLEQYYSDDKEGDRRMSRPESHLLFGPFIYDGMIKVEFNLEPKI